MPYGRRSLYDSFQLANSSVVPQYLGSAAPEALRVADYNQGLYNQAQAGAFGIGANVDSVQSLDIDKKLADELSTNVRNKIAEFAKRGDYENMLPAVQTLATEFSSRARELAAPMAAYQKWNEELDNKELNLTPYQKEGLRGLAMSRYKGLKKGASGRYEGTFSGGDVAANMDVNKWVDDRLKDIAIQKGGSEGYSEPGTGDYMIKKGNTWERLPAATIRQVLQSAAAGDQNLQAYIAQMGSIAGYRSSKLSPDTLSPTIKAQIKTLTDKGYSPAEAQSQVFSAIQSGEITRNMLDYGVGKYQRNNVTTTMDMSADPFALKDQDKEGADPYQVAGPNSAVLPDEHDYTKVTGNLKDWSNQASVLNAQIAGIQKKLEGKVDPDTRTQLQTQMFDLQQQQGGLQLSIKRAQDMIDYNKNQTAIKLGYKGGYSEYLSSTIPELEARVKTVMGHMSIKTPSGKHITSEDIAAAIADGRVEVKDHVNTGYMSSTLVVDGLYYTDKSGNKTYIGSRSMGRQLGSLVGQINTDKNYKGNRYNSELENGYSSNIENYSVQGNYVNIGESDRKELTNLVNSAGGGLKLTLPGDYMNEIPEKERPARVEVQSIRGIAPNGIVTVSVQGYDENGKSLGTEGRYEAHLSNSNIGKVLGDKWLKADAKGNAPEARQAYRNIQPGSSASVLSTTPVGSSIELGEAEGHGQVKLRVTRSGSNTYYSIVDANGNILSTSGGKRFQTTDIGTAGNWMDSFKTQ